MAVLPAHPHRRDINGTPNRTTTASKTHKNARYLSDIGHFCVFLRGKLFPLLCLFWVPVFRGLWKAFPLPYVFCFAGTSCMVFGGDLGAAFPCWGGLLFSAGIQTPGCRDKWCRRPGCPFPPAGRRGRTGAAGARTNSGTRSPQSSRWP